MQGFRQAVLSAVAALLAIGFALPAKAQGKVDARFVATLNGLPIGRGAWVIDISEDQFTAAASGGTAGLLQMFAKGKGTAAARGPVIMGGPIGAIYSATLTTERKVEEVRMSIVSGAVRDVVVTPPQPPSPLRVPVTDAHRQGVSDPMSAMLIRVPGQGPLIAPEACPASMAVFDGRVRFDLRFAFKRIEIVKTERGYEGPVVVCAVYFTPVAGHEPGRFVIKYLSEQRDTEIWLAPVAGTRVMVMYRASIPTPVGLGVLQATQFLTTPHVSRVGQPRTQ